MKEVSTHSQDYGRKHGNDHDVKDKAGLKNDFIRDKRKDAREEHTDHFTSRAPAEGK